MPVDRLARILALLSAGGETDPGVALLCRVCASVTSTNGAVIMILSDDVPSGSWCTPDKVSHLIEELQYTLGEGPCVDAYHLECSVVEPDLSNPQTVRWPAFSPVVLQAGVRSVFGFPLRIGAVRLGALGLYRDRAKPLTSNEHADALTVADVATRAVLALQASATPGDIAAELETGANFRFVVHQACGMVAVQLGISVTEALIRLRACAFANDRPINEIGEDIVARRLRFHPRSGEACKQ
jgi:GAF domain-containing protein